jgi:hypothetical protein
MDLALVVLLDSSRFSSINWILLVTVLPLLKRINFDDFNYQTQAANHAVWIGKKCHGVVEVYFLDGVHAGCSEDVLDSEGFAGGDFSNDLDDPNDSDIVMMRMGMMRIWRGGINVAWRIIYCMCGISNSGEEKS